MLRPQYGLVTTGILYFTCHFFLHFESKKALSHVAEKGYHYCSQNTCRSRIDAAGIVKEGYEKIREYGTGRDRHQIAKELHPTPKVGLLEYDVSRHNESIWSRYNKSHNQCRDCCAYHGKWKMDILLVKEIMVRAVIDSSIQ